ncbi:MAG: hypothetical protein WC755_09645, partial [Candidatus Woesearchaeota archaeon]
MKRLAMLVVLKGTIQKNKQFEQSKLGIKMTSQNLENSVKNFLANPRVLALMNIFSNTPLPNSGVLASCLFGSNYTFSPCLPEPEIIRSKKAYSKTRKSKTLQNETFHELSKG